MIALAPERQILDQLAQLDPTDREQVLEGLSPAALAQLERDLAQGISLREFIRLAWPVVEPSTVFIPGWHIDCIAEHLEAVSAGQLRNLLINIPPRHAKSLTASVFWPVWEWTVRPWRRWLFSSYALPLAIRDSLKCRRLIESPWFQRCYSHVFTLTTDQNTKMRFDNDKTGYRLATSVGGSNTGEGGDIIVVDDPHNVKEADSELKREDALRWWDEVMPTRGNDPKTVAKVIIMQRVHQADLAGHVLERGGYHHLCLPAEYEPRRHSYGNPAIDPPPHDDCDISSDPRTIDGELIWPERFGPDELSDLKTELNSSYAVSGQLQQRPTPRAGALFRAEWFQPLPSPEEFSRIRPKLNVVSYYDLAFSKKDTADYTAGVTIGIDPRTQKLYILHAWRDRIEERALDTILCDQISNQKPMLVGLEAGAYRQAATHDLVFRLATLLSKNRVATTVTAVPVTTDKVFRAQLPAGRAESGFIYADKLAPWWRPFESELLRFPKGTNDDQVDALSGAVQLAIERGRPLSKTPSPVIFTSGRKVINENDPFTVARHLRLLEGGRAS